MMSVLTWLEGIREIMRIFLWKREGQTPWAAARVVDSTIARLEGAIDDLDCSFVCCIVFSERFL